MDVVTLEQAKADAKRKYVPKATQRTAAVMLTAPNAVAAATALDLTQRTMVALPFAAPEWYLEFRNQSGRQVAPSTTPCTIADLWVGDPAFPTGNTTETRWLGDCTAAMTQVMSTPIVVPTNGAWVATPAVSSQQFALNAGKVLSWGLTSTNSGNGIAQAIDGYQGVSVAGASHSGDTTLTSPIVSTAALYLDVRLVYKFSESVKIVVFAGDSLGVGYGPAPAGIASSKNGSLPHESWPMVAGKMGGFSAVNLSVASTEIGDFATTYQAALWSRLPAGVVPDAVINSLGSNGLQGGYANFVTSSLALHTKERTLFGATVPIWEATISPRAYPDGAYTSGGTKIAGFLSADATSGATTISLPFSPAIGTNLQVGIGPTQQVVRISSVTGSGPYIGTLQTTGGFTTLTAAHYAGEPVAQAGELTRRQFNNYLRVLPDGISGVLDFERLLEASIGSYLADQRYVGSDFLHFVRGVAAVKASLAVGIGAQPKFGV